MTKQPTPLELLALSALALMALAPAGCHSGGGGAAHDGGAGADGGRAGADGGAAGAPDGGGDATAACTAGGQGQLVLAVTGLPAGSAPMVRLNGGGLAAPMVLPVGTPVSLTGGKDYVVETRRFKVAPAAGAIVGKAYYVSGSSFDGCVRADATTTVTLTYTQEPGSEHVWVGVSNAATLGNELGGFAGGDLVATAAKNPMIWKTQNFVGRPGAGAFDPFGDFWVPGGDVVNMYKMETLATPGSAPPEVILTQPANAPATFAAFDSQGNLWISRGAPANQVVRYTVVDQQASGSPTPAVILSGAHVMNPSALAFDFDGNLWVASQATDEVVAFAPAHQGASYTGAPDVVLTAQTAAGAPVQGPYTGPTGLAIDQSKTLWVGFEGKLVGFTHDQQGTSATIMGPLAVDISTGTGGFGFDESGGLWVGGGDPKTFRRYPKTALAATGTPTPDIVITSSDFGDAESIVLDPAPTWSPLQDLL